MRWLVGSLLACATILAFVPALPAQETGAGEADPLGVERETSGEGESTASPFGAVVVVTAEQIAGTGLARTSQVLHRLVPSFQRWRRTGEGVAAHARGASPRGFSGDQVLILVDGTPWHARALAEGEGPVGAAALGVGLDVIPVGAIERIEVLPGGAAARFGSGTVAGVINVVLRRGEGGRLESGAGEGAGGAEVVWAAGEYGGEWGGGWFSVAADARDRAVVFPEGESREVPHEPAAQELGLAINGGVRMGGVEVYGFGVVGGWRSETVGRYRASGEGAVPLYPTGYRPRIVSDVVDAGGAVGARGRWGAWEWDAFTRVGGSVVALGARNTLNLSMGSSSPTSFDAGTLRASGAAVTLEVSRRLEGMMGVPLGITGRVEIQRESYGIEAGDEASYVDGGAAGLPGLRPRDAVAAAQTAVVAALSFDAAVASALHLVVSGHLRDDEASDDPMAGQAAVRWSPAPWVRVHGGVATGYRVPSLRERHFSWTSVRGEGEAGQREVRVRPAGAGTLGRERVGHAGGGVALLPAPGIVAAVDYARTTVGGRVVLSGAVPVTGEWAVRSFSNALDTETRALDATASLDTAVLGGRVRLSLGASWTRTRVVEVGAGAINSVEVEWIEEAVPALGAILGVDYRRGAFRATLGNRYHGAASAFDLGAERLLPLAGGWVTDLLASWTYADRLELATGAHNVFDTRLGTDRLPLDAVLPYDVERALFFLRLAVRF